MLATTSCSIKGEDWRDVLAGWVQPRRLCQQSFVGGSTFFGYRHIFSDLLYQKSVLMLVLGRFSFLQMWLLLRGCILTNGPGPVFCLLVHITQHVTKFSLSGWTHTRQYWQDCSHAVSACAVSALNYRLSFIFDGCQSGTLWKAKFK